MTRLPCLPVAALVIVLSNAGPSTVPAEANDDVFADLSRDFIDRFTALSPVSATNLGDHRYDGKLDEISGQSRQASVEFYQSFLKQLDEIERSKLSRAHQVDYALLRHDLKSRLWRLESLQEWSWNPLVYTSLTGQSIYGLMARDFAPTEKRLANAASRMRQFPRLLKQVRATLEPRRVPSVHAETAVRQNRGVLSTIDNLVVPALKSVSEKQRRVVEAAIAIARKAIEEHQQWLEKELVPNAAGNFRIGPRQYDQKLAFTLHTDLTRQQIRDRAESELRRVRAEMYGIACDVYRKKFPLTRFPENPTHAYQQAIIRAGLEAAYEQVPQREKVVQAAKESLRISTSFIRKKDLITIPDDPLEIIIMPEFQRGVSTAYCDSPGPLDAGQKTFYAVAPLPENWSDKQVASYLREYNTRSLHNLTIHEAMPGHFLQLAHANQYPSQLRAVLSSGVFIEGWACYTEQMMMRQGFLDGDPLMKLITLKWYLRSIVNAIIDQSIHVDGMRREEAMRMMIEDGFQEEREAAGKWIRAQLTSVQLSTYFVGLQEHWDLRDRAEKAAGESFSLKQFHDKALSFGSPPVRFVRALMLREAIPE